MRHCLGHGTHFTDPSGVSPCLATASNVCVRLANSLRHFSFVQPHQVVEWMMFDAHVHREVPSVNEAEEAELLAFGVWSSNLLARTDIG